MLACVDLQNNSVSQVPPQLGTVTTLKYVGVNLFQDNISPTNFRTIMMRNESHFPGLWLHKIVVGLLLCW